MAGSNWKHVNTGMYTAGWVLFLDQVYPYHLREVLNSVHLFNGRPFTDRDYELLDDYFGNETEIRSRPSEKFLEIWPRVLELVTEHADAVKKDIDPELPPEVVSDVWIPALKRMIAAARENPCVVWTTVSLVVRGEYRQNGPINQSVLIRELNRNLSRPQRAKAKQILSFGRQVPDYLDGFIQTYNVIGSLLNNRTEYLNFDPRKSEHSKPEYFRKSSEPTGQL